MVRSEKMGLTTTLHSNDFVLDEDGFRAGVLAFIQFVLDSAEASLMQIRPSKFGGSFNNNGEILQSLISNDRVISDEGV